MSQSHEIGRLLRAGTNGFVVGIQVTKWEVPKFGALVRVPIGSNYEIYGLIHDIHIDDDGLVRQLATADSVDEQVIKDNRENRGIPIEMSVISIGYSDSENIRHLLPPRPALSLDSMHLCTDAELCDFTDAGNFGYFRHILRMSDQPVGELLAAHLEQAGQAHRRAGNDSWMEAAARELIVLLRDDYPKLMSVLSALGDTNLYPD